MAEVKLYEWSEIAQHNTRNDLWMVIEDKVYDVTKFLDEHPGGEEVLLEQAGVDATEAFDEIGHSDDARELLKGMYKGDLKPSEKGKKAVAQAATAAKDAVKDAANESKSFFSSLSTPTILYALTPIIVLGAFAISKYLEKKNA
ncbi:hypothetical protein HDV00_005044 [Rhizophlyctis rosea]|nr:hypothetical protein HDV00_005044 [Rhizophlyctis rosea]